MAGAGADRLFCGTCEIGCSAGGSGCFAGLVQTGSVTARVAMRSASTEPVLVGRGVNRGVNCSTCIRDFSRGVNRGVNRGVALALVINTHPRYHD